MKKVKLSAQKIGSLQYYADRLNLSKTQVNGLKQKYGEEHLQALLEGNVEKVIDMSVVRGIVHGVSGIPEKVINNFSLENIQKHIFNESLDLIVDSLAYMKVFVRSKKPSFVYVEKSKVVASCLKLFMPNIPHF